MTPIRGIIFDKDGTLFDFNATWGAWSQGMLRDLAGGDAALLARLAEVMGFDTDRQCFRPGSIVIAETTAFVAQAVLPYLDGMTLDEIVSQMKSMSRHVPQIQAAPLRPLMQRLKADGFRLGVVTNDNEAPAQAHLKGAEIDGMIDFVAGYDSGHGAKPDPAPLLAFCAATGLAPEYCVMIGDSLHDLHAGRAAGMATVGVLTGPAPEAELAPLSDVVLASIADLPEWLALRNAAS
jgi:phosphoglycolate phosphatase